MNNIKPLKRVLLKLSWEALMWKQEYGIDVEFLADLSRKIVTLANRSIEIIIVIWWWNIFRWVSWAAKWLDRASWDYMWMLATIMNWIALWDALEKAWKYVRIMSAIEVPKVSEPFIRRRAIKHLERWRIVISVAWTWNPYFTTDSAAILRALELSCDIMIKWTKVDGIYDKDPMKNPDAVKYEELSIQEAIVNNIKVMDQSALALARDEKMPIFVCKIEDIDKIWTGEIKWTYVYVD